MLACGQYPISGLAEEDPVDDLTRITQSVDTERAKALGWRDKAVQPEWYAQSTPQVVSMHPRLEHLSTPLMTLDSRAIAANLAAMSEWCRDVGVSHAPHGKTTMAPALWREQLRAGCWGITVANEPQLRVARAVGVPRIVLANLFLRPAGLRWLVAELDSDATFEFVCWVDSVEAVQIMQEALATVHARRTIHVLIELGHPHARTGARTVDDALRVAEAVLGSSALTLAGVAGYEGSVAHGTDDEALLNVDRYLRTMVELHTALTDRYEVDEVVISAGGSAFFDRAAAILGPEQLVPTAAHTVRVVLRPGAYLVHDDGYYREATPHGRGTGPAFRSAMHAWTRVISMPEPGIVYLDAGKRDLPFDEGLPELHLLRRDGGVIIPLANHNLFAMNDQHSHVRVPTDSPLRVGDVVRLGLSHPCTAFDKWSLIPVLDDSSADNPVVVDLIRTYF